MAVSGVILLFYVAAHMVGTLKVFLGTEHINRYAEWLRTLGEPALPRTIVLWGMRSRAHPRLLLPHPRRVPTHADQPRSAPA